MISEPSQSQSSQPQSQSNSQSSPSPNQQYYNKKNYPTTMVSSFFITNREQLLQECSRPGNTSKEHVKNPLSRFVNRKK